MKRKPVNLGGGEVSNIAELKANYWKKLSYYMFISLNKIYSSAQKPPFSQLPSLKLSHLPYYHYSVHRS